MVSSLHLDEPMLYHHFSCRVLAGPLLRCFFMWCCMCVNLVAFSSPLSHVLSLLSLHLSSSCTLTHASTDLAFGAFANVVLHSVFCLLRSSASFPHLTDSHTHVLSFSAYLVCIYVPHSHSCTQLSDHDRSPHSSIIPSIGPCFGRFPMWCLESVFQSQLRALLGTGMCTVSNFQFPARCSSSRINHMVDFWCSFVCQPLIRILFSSHGLHPSFVFCLFLPPSLSSL